MGAGLTTHRNNCMADYKMYIIACGVTNGKCKPDLEYKTQELKMITIMPKHLSYEIYCFRQGKQETLDQFHIRLRAFTPTCEFLNIDFEVEKQIKIEGISS